VVHRAIAVPVDGLATFLEASTTTTIARSAQSAHQRVRLTITGSQYLANLLPKRVPIPLIRRE
jgi:hypothetical protein